jgi:tetratricopeptide (TPR) repeat protein
VKNLPGEILSEQESCELSKEWLESESSGGCMLFIDNLNIIGDEFQIVERLLPKTKGCIIITAAFYDYCWDKLVPRTNAIPVREMTLGEARKVLAAFKITSKDLQEVDDLVNELGCIPLAIELAAGYIQSCGLTLKEYMLELKTRASHPGKLSDGSKGAAPLIIIQKAWKVSFLKLEAVDVSAARLLQHMSFLSARKVPKSLLVAGNNDTSPGIEKPGSIEFNKAIRQLLAFNFIDIDHEEGDSRTYRIHAAISECSRRTTHTEKTIERLVYRDALHSVARVFMNKPSASFRISTHQLDATSRVLPYGEFVLEYQPESTKQLEDIRVTTRKLRYELAKTRYLTGNYENAKSHLCQYQKDLDNDGLKYPPSYFMASGMIKKALGFYVGALSDFEQATEDLQAEDLNEPTALLHEIKIEKANVLRDQGMYQKLEKLYQELRSTPKEAMARETRVYLESCYGGFLAKQGRYEEAIEVYKVNLDSYKFICEQKGEDPYRDENRYLTLASIAVAQMYSKSPDRAYKSFNEAIKGMEDLHRKDHPKTLLMEIDKAEAIAMQDDTQSISDALEKMREVLSRLEQLSNSCEQTLTARHRLGALYSREQNHDAALFQFTAVLRVRKEREKLGERLPIEYYLTLFCQADIHKEQGLFEKALAEYDEVENGLREMCMPGHPFFFSIKLGRAEFPQFQRDYLKAKELLSNARNEALEMYGSDSTQFIDADAMLEKVKGEERQNGRKPKRRSCFFVFGR